jgi:hypothetical protein
LKSIKIPRVHIPAELGAMRFTSRHLLLNNLLTNLKIESREVDLGEMYFLRGHRMSPDDKDKFCVRHPPCNKPIRVYNLEEEERTLGSCTKLIIYAIEQTLRALHFPNETKEVQEHLQQQINECLQDPDEKIKLERLNALNWNVIKGGRLHIKVAGEKLRRIDLDTVGLWNLLQHFLSNEACLLIHDSLGYESVVGNWNAADAIPWFLAEFAEQKWKMIPEGFQHIIERLEEEILKHGGDVKTKHQLEVIKPINQGDYKWELQFKGNDKKYIARKVILALPRKPLEELEVRHKRWKNIVKKEMLSKVHPHKLFKLFVVYKEAWWAKLKQHEELLALPGGDNGRVFTDLPVRQIYYYGPEWIKAHSGKEFLRKRRQSWSLLMIYNDSHYVGFWSTFSAAASPDSKAANRGKKYLSFPTNDGLSPQEKEKLREIADSDEGAWERMIDKIHGLLVELHGVDPNGIPRPIIGVYKDWRIEGGWHTWEIHESSKENASKIIEPITDLFICGEAYSTEQGWVEGALKTTEWVLKRLDLPNPSWFLPVDEFIRYTRI